MLTRQQADELHGYVSTLILTRREQSVADAALTVFQLAVSAPIAMKARILDLEKAYEQARHNYQKYVESLTEKGNT